MEDENPIGTYAIKLAKFMIEFNRDIIKMYKRADILKLVMSFFTIDHEKCNANTFKLLSC